MSFLFLLEGIRNFADTFRQIAHKEKEKRIVFLKSWNEWGEGNYMEPDLKFGRGYLEALKQAIDKVF